MAERERQSYPCTVYEVAQALAPGWERHRARKRTDYQGVSLNAVAS